MPTQAELDEQAKVEAAKQKASDDEARAAELKAKADAESRAKADQEMVSKDYADRLRREKAEAEKELRAMKDAQEDAERKKLAADKEYQKMAELEAKKREEVEKDFAEKLSARDKRTIRAELKAAALAQGIIDVDLVGLVDSSSVTIDDDGEVVGAKEAITALKTSKPALFGRPEGNTEGDNKKSQKRQPGESTEHKGLDPYALDQKEFDRQYEKLGKVQTV